MLIKTKGIIFRSIKYSETSIITNIFTEKKGLRTYIISGVRKKNARVSASLLQVMSVVDLVVYHRDDKDMTRIKEIKAAHIYQSLPFEIIKSSVGQFMLELTRKAVREPEENLPMFEFVYEIFQYLDETQLSFSNLHLYFMLRLSGYLGFMPEDNFSKNYPFFNLQEGIFVEKKEAEGSEGSDNKIVRPITNIKGTVQINGEPVGPGGVVILETKSKLKVPKQEATKVKVFQRNIQFEPKNSVIMVAINTP